MYCVFSSTPLHFTPIGDYCGRFVLFLKHIFVFTVPPPQPRQLWVCAPGPGRQLQSARFWQFCSAGGAGRAAPCPRYLVCRYIWISTPCLYLRTTTARHCACAQLIYVLQRVRGHACVLGNTSPPPPPPTANLSCQRNFANIYHNNWRMSLMGRLFEN